MTSTKKAFGAFVAARRQAASLTQRELAERLYVTESAVSKWERGVSFPDISLVASLARELGVTERELINASDDPVSRQLEREARLHRRWKAAIRRATLIAYAVTVVTCFIVNLAVAQALDWFWVVLAAVAVAFSLTTLPLLPVRRRGWTVLGAFLVSLIALLVFVRVLYGSGYWLPIAVAAVLFVALVIFGPFLLRELDLPAALARHRTVLALAADTIGLALLLLVVFVALDDLDTLVDRALPIAALAVLFAWAPALVIRYVRLSGPIRAAIVVALVSLYQYFAFQPAVAGLIDEPLRNPVNLSEWHDPYVDGNVALTVMLGGLFVSVVLTIVGVLRRRPD